MSTQTLEKPESSFELTQKNQPLHDSVRQALENYLSQLKDNPTDLYQLILAEVEAPLMGCVMDYTKNNQSGGGKLLGLSRGALRNKLKEYELLD